MWEDKPIGHYEPVICKKGENECTIETIKEGDLFWTIKMDEESFYDTASQDVALQISLQVECLEKLKAIEKTCLR